MPDFSNFAQKTQKFSRLRRKISRGARSLSILSTMKSDLESLVVAILATAWKEDLEFAFRKITVDLALWLSNPPID